MVTPPPPARREATVDVLHGHEVADPYRWLEDGDAAEVAAWVAAQNERTRAALDARPDRRAWLDRLVACSSCPISTGVRLAGDRVFSLERGGGQKQLVARRPARRRAGRLGRASWSTRPRWRPTRRPAIDWYHPSLDGGLVAYGVSEGGDERSVAPDPRRRHPQAPERRDPRDPRRQRWPGCPGGAAFLYSRYPDGDQYNRRIYRHRLGRAVDRRRAGVGRPAQRPRRGPTSPRRPTAASPS